MNCKVCNGEITHKFYVEMSWRIMKCDKNYVLPDNIKLDVFRKLEEPFYFHKSCLLKVLKALKGG